jgi:hypothetical protein
MDIKDISVIKAVMDTRDICIIKGIVGNAGSSA